LRSGINPIFRYEDLDNRIGIVSEFSCDGMKTKYS
jgi:hypothetical protein